MIMFETSKYNIEFDFNSPTLLKLVESYATMRVVEHIIQEVQKDLPVDTKIPSTLNSDYLWSKCRTYNFPKECFKSATHQDYE